MSHSPATISCPSRLPALSAFPATFIGLYWDLQSTWLTLLLSVHLSPFPLSLPPWPWCIIKNNLFQIPLASLILQQSDTLILAKPSSFNKKNSKIIEVGVCSWFQSFVLKSRPHFLLSYFLNFFFTLLQFEIEVFSHSVICQVVSCSNPLPHPPLQLSLEKKAMYTFQQPLTALPVHLGI